VTLRRVLKYALKFTADAQVLTLPAGARVVHVGSHRDTPTIWTEVDENETAVERRTFWVVATGFPVPNGPWHIGAAHIDWSVLHIYEGEAR